FFQHFFLYGDEYFSGEVRNCKYSKKSNGYYFFSSFTAFETQLASFFFFYVGKLFIPSWIFLDSLKGYKKFNFHLHLTRIYILGGCPCLGSDTGGDEIIAGNVNKYTVLPAGYSGQPKKGHLVFDACFESGNLGRVDYITEFEYDLFIRPDTCNPRFRVWFNFTVENVKESQKE
uniref:CBPC6 carboxypeptidase n=1 Tax=Meleagris gallopavo TaxID=9103 RepID=A0A803XKK8_MELGA